MNKGLVQRLFCVMMLLSVTHFAMAGQRIDDSATEVLAPFVKMEWKNPLAVKGGGDPNALVGQSEIVVRLNTQPWVGKTGRIVMKTQHPANMHMQAQWVFRQGLLRSGVLQSGEETVVYDGMITQEIMEDRMTLQMNVEGDPRDSYERVEFFFEFEE